MISLTLSIMALALSASIIPAVIVTTLRARDSISGEVDIAKKRLVQMELAIGACGCEGLDAETPLAFE